jgi:predicted negative regulator of RcsB-dependent stress response
MYNNNITILLHREFFHGGELMKKNLMYIVSGIVLIAACVFGYITYKQQTAKSAVREYLIHEKNIDPDDIEKLEPFIANLPGDKNWMVFVKLKNDKKHYSYYKDRKRNKVILESTNLNGDSW